MAQQFEVTLQGTYLAQTIINRLNFVSDNDTLATANSLGLGFALGFNPAAPSAPIASTTLQAFLAAQTTGYQLDQIMIRNLFNVTDFYTAAVSGTGWAGTSVATTTRSLSFVANKLQTNRVRTDIRRGTLALTPLGEEVYDPEGTISPGGLALLIALCVELNTPPTRTVGGDTTLFQPAVASKEKYDVPGSSPVRKAYRYWADPAVQLSKTAVNVTWFAVGRATSQTSRRIGKGI